MSINILLDLIWNLRNEAIKINIINEANSLYLIPFLNSFENYFDQYLKNKTSKPLTFWEFVKLCFFKNKTFNDIINFVNQNYQLLSNVNKSKIFIKYSLMYHYLPDMIQQMCLKANNNNLFSKFYNLDFPLYDSRISNLLIQSLYTLNDVTFIFPSLNATLFESSKSTDKNYSPLLHGANYSPSIINYLDLHENIKDYLLDQYNPHNILLKNKKSRSVKPPLFNNSDFILVEKAEDVTFYYNKQQEIFKDNHVYSDNVKSGLIEDQIIENVKPNMFKCPKCTSQQLYSILKHYPPEFLKGNIKKCYSDSWLASPPSIRVLNTINLKYGTLNKLKSITDHQNHVYKKLKEANFSHLGNDFQSKLCLYLDYLYLHMFINQRQNSSVSCSQINCETDVIQHLNRLADDFIDALEYLPATTSNSKFGHEITNNLGSNLNCNKQPLTTIQTKDDIQNKTLYDEFKEISSQKLENPHRSFPFNAADNCKSLTDHYFAVQPDDNSYFEGDFYIDSSNYTSNKTSANESTYKIGSLVRISDSLNSQNAKLSGLEDEVTNFLKHRNLNKVVTDTNLNPDDPTNNLEESFEDTFLSELKNLSQHLTDSANECSEMRQKNLELSGTLSNYVHSNKILQVRCNELEAKNFSTKRIFERQLKEVEQDNRELKRNLIKFIKEKDALWRLARDLELNNAPTRENITFPSDGDQNSCKASTIYDYTSYYSNYLRPSHLYNSIFPVDIPNASTTNVKATLTPISTTNDSIKPINITSVPACSKCHKNFRLIIRKSYTCSGCNKLFCHHCSNNWAITPFKHCTNMMVSEKPQPSNLNPVERYCDKCYENEFLNLKPPPNQPQCFPLSDENFNGKLTAQSSADDASTVSINTNQTISSSLSNYINKLFIGQQSPFKLLPNNSEEINDKVIKGKGNSDEQLENVQQEALDLIIMNLEPDYFWIHEPEP